MRFLRSRLRRLWRDEGGFTLVELVTVLALMLITMTALSYAMIAAHKTEEDLNRRFASQVNARIALDKLRREIHCASAVTPAGSSATITITLGFAGTATFANDYVISGTTWNATSRTITLAAGVASATLTATPVDDTSPETNETIILAVQPGAGYLVTNPSSGTATITDNDNTLPSLSVGDAQIVEGNKGQATVIVTVTLSRASTTTVTATG